MSPAHEAPILRRTTASARSTYVRRAPDLAMYISATMFGPRSRWISLASETPSRRNSVLTITSCVAVMRGPAPLEKTDAVARRSRGLAGERESDNHPERALIFDIPREGVQAKHEQRSRERAGGDVAGTGRAQRADEDERHERHERDGSGDADHGRDVDRCEVCVPAVVRRRAAGADTQRMLADRRECIVEMDPARARTV